MGDFKRPGGGFGGNKGRGGFGGRDGGRPSFSGRPSFGGGRDERSEMFPATCDSCHRQCEVPFRPNGSKPVYCNNCFSSKKDDFSPRGSAPRRSEQKDSFSFGTPKSEHQAAPAVQDKRVDEIKKGLDLLNAKVDKLLNMMLTGAHPKTASPAKAPSQPEVVAKAAEPEIKTAPVAKDKKTPKKAATPVVKKEVKKKTTTKKK
jgi:CxxC-x17-CxxC domain-containing protein